MSSHKSKLSLSGAAQGGERLLFQKRGGGEVGLVRRRGAGLGRKRAILQCFSEILLRRRTLNSNDVAQSE